MPLRLTLTGLASQYIHMPLAPFCLKKAVEASGLPVSTTVCDLNINDTQEDLLARIMATAPDVLGVSLYIWNRDCAARLIRRVKALRPEITVIVGGPEATFSVPETFREMPADYLLRGAGEESLPTLLRILLEGGDPADVPGCCFRTADGLHTAPPAPAPAPRSDLYDDEWYTALNGRMAYVETSRGCPFRCAFCLSGHHHETAPDTLGDGKRSFSPGGQKSDLRCGNKEAPEARPVAFMPVDEALALLIRIGNSGCDTVKLIDRTFNCHKARTMALLRGLIDAKAQGLIGEVCYHFEVAADLFDDEALALLATAPVGLFQMEAGLQSFHGPTLDACDRYTDMAWLTNRIQRILAPGNIHLHIDLIAGLPQEDFATFGRSFDRAFALGPHQLQLGFLKFIHGSRLRREEWGARFAPDPPYEVLSTPWISYAELRRLHDAAEAVERIHNSGRFTLAEQLALDTGIRPFELYLLLGERMAARQGRWSLDALTRLVYETFLSLGADGDVLRDAMILDRLATDNTGYLPPFLQGEPAAVKDAARACRAANPDVRHPRVALLSDGSAAFAVWTHKHPVTQRGAVERLSC
ncbi:MAG: B12-binding domain-containing radical SAM protein [Clostridia bacterium]|nr:B12-binding domain-containing radical SAM protein [Clostridia bacterium]